MFDINDEVYEPYIRVDQYGHLGQAPQPRLEYIRLALLAVTVVPLKALGAIFCLVSFYTICRLSVVLSGPWRARVVAVSGKFYCRLILLSFGFLHVRWRKLHDQQQQPTANGNQNTGFPAVGIVSNHVGWPDILIHMSRFFPSFVSRRATQDVVMIGFISELMGCIYVDRDTSKNHQGVALAVKEKMAKAARGQASSDRPMLLFPEGTTTNGNFLLPFKTGAFLAGAPVQPVILRYDKGRVSPAWETISAPRQIFLLLCNPFHGVTCYELPVYHPSEAEVRDPGLYARNVREYMLYHSAGLKPSNSTLKDKLVLHAYLKGKDSPIMKKRQ